ncbi:MAG: hypothetical protein JJ964_06820 [Rhizobiales bacterium]|nr:hypothetical protein [Hyphomicrobiales bacterium]
MFKIEGRKVLFNKSAIYEAPVKIIDSLVYKDDLIILYDPDEDNEEYGLNQNAIFAMHNVRRIASTGEEVWKIHGTGSNSGYWKIYIDEDDRYWAAGGDNHHCFDPETGEVLGLYQLE